MTNLIRLLALIAGFGIPCFSQVNPDLHTYFKKHIGLSDKQIDSVRSGEGFAKTLPSRIPDEIFVFGAVYISASPESSVNSRGAGTTRRVWHN